MTRTNNTMTQSDNSINKITANTSNRGRGRGQHGSLGVCVCQCVCVDHCFSHTCGGCVISFLACPLKLDVKVIGAFEYSLTISVSVCVSV